MADSNNQLNGHAENTLTATETLEAMGDNHVGTSLETPLRPDALLTNDADKIAQIQEHFAQIMDILGLDRTDDSLSGTPYRVAKMYVREIFEGLNPANKPQVKTFENKYQYGEMLVEKNIILHSTCEHHFLPIFGHAHVAYISSGTVIGLSKINRVVRYFAKRPQVQERLTRQIAEELKKVLRTEDVAIVIEAKHLCVASRGIQDVSSTTVTADYSGKFREKTTRNEFLDYLKSSLTKEL